MNTRRALIASALALAFAAPAFAQQQPQITPLAGPERAEALARANRTLNGVSRLQGRFVQTSPDGARTAGAFYLQRPGKLRFDYDPPATLLIVSDGNVVHMRDRALRTTERTPLASTPLNLVLRAQVDLARDSRIIRVSQSGDWLMITARDRSGQTDGQIQLNFFGPQTELRSWDVTDATGARTRILLSDLTQPASFDRRLFRMEDLVNAPRPGPH